MIQRHPALLGTLAAVTAASLFGTLGPLSRFGAEVGVGGPAFTAWRAACGAAFLAVFILLRGDARSSLAALRALPRSGRLSLGLASLMGVTLNTALFTAFGIAPIALVLTLFYLFPAGVVITDLVLGRERATVPRIAALLLSTGGVGLVVLGGGITTPDGSVNLLGVGLGLLAAVCQTIFVTTSRSGYASVPAPAATFVVLATAMTFASGVAVVGGVGDDLLIPFSTPSSWLILLTAGVAAAGIASLLFLSAIRGIGGSRTGILMLFEPVVGTLLAAVWLGEGLAPAQVLGGILVLAGALVLQIGADPGLDPLEETAAGPAA